MVGESDQNEFLIQIDASSSAEFEISEFEIFRVDCILLLSYRTAMECMSEVGNMTFITGADYCDHEVWAMTEAEYKMNTTFINMFQHVSGLNFSECEDYEEPGKPRPAVN